MKKVPFSSPWPIVSGLLFFCLLCGLTLPVVAADGYRIRYKYCTVQAAADSSLSVTDVVKPSGYVKIQYLKKLPVSVAFDANGISKNTPPGTLYVTAPRVIPQVTIDGELGTFYTEARVSILVGYNYIQNVTCKKAWIGLFQGMDTVGRLKMSAEENLLYGNYATTSLIFYGSSPRPPMSAQFSGVIVEVFVSDAPLSSLKVASKKCHTDLPVQYKNFISQGGIGRLTPSAATSSTSYGFHVKAIDKLQVTGGAIVPDSFLSYEPVTSIRATSLRFSNVLLLGIVGMPYGLSPTMATFGAPRFGSIYGEDRVQADFWVGPKGYPNIPFHQGTIAKIMTHPKTGALNGTAHVAPGNQIQFVPKDHPGFTVCDNPGAH